MSPLFARRPRRTRALVQSALESNLNVLCEKPLATRAFDAHELTEIARIRGLKLRTSAKYRFAAGRATRQKLARFGRTATRRNRFWRAVSLRRFVARERGTERRRRVDGQRPARARFGALFRTRFNRAQCQKMALRRRFGNRSRASVCAAKTASRFKSNCRGCGVWAIGLRFYKAQMAQSKSVGAKRGGSQMAARRLFWRALTIKMSVSLDSGAIFVQAMRFWARTTARASWNCWRRFTNGRAHTNRAGARRARSAKLRLR